MNSDEIRSGIYRVWAYKLRNEWSKIWSVLHKEHRIILYPPNFEIVDMSSFWGKWHPDTRTISISIHLLRNYDWDAAAQTLKHEMAHQIVSECFKGDSEPHGEGFKKACVLLGIDSQATRSREQMAGITGGDDKFVTKIKKLLAKGSDESVTEAEGEIFLQKAQELMLRYNLEIADIVNTGEFFVQRPVTAEISPWPTYLSSIGYLMSQFYNVQYIRCFANGKAGYLEYFGTPGNVDIAEYITHVLLQQGESLYKDFLKAHRQRRASGFYCRNASKAAFMSGLIEGYRQKLAAQKAVILSQMKTEVNGEHKCVLVSTSKRVLDEKYKSVYNPKYKSMPGPRGEGFSNGREAGGRLTINPGVKGGGSGLCLKG